MATVATDERKDRSMGYRFTRETAARLISLEPEMKEAIGDEPLHVEAQVHVLTDFQDRTAKRYAAEFKALQATVKATCERFEAANGELAEFGYDFACAPELSAAAAGFAAALDRTATGLSDLLEEWEREAAEFEAEFNESGSDVVIIDFASAEITTTEATAN